MNKQWVNTKAFAAKFTFFAMYFHGALMSTATQAATLNLSELPLAVAANVPPNVVVTMDDSGSMAWGYMPDSVGGDWNTRAYRSANYNKVMYDPTVTYEPPVNADGSQESDANFNAAVRGFYYSGSNRDTFDLASEYAAIYTHYSYASVDLMQSDEVAAYGCDPTLCTDEAAHYYVFNDDADCTGTDADKLVSNTCYDKVVVTDSANYSGGVNTYGRTIDEEKTNFANWFQYYGIRGDSAKTALMRAFSPEDVDDSVRVGRQTFNANRSVRAGSPSSSVSGVRSFSDANERQNFYDWIETVPTSGGTPLRSSVVRAGEFYKTDNPYRVDPADSSSATVSCRVNTHMLVTDGFYNGSFSTPSNFVDDNAGGGTYTLPDGRVYTPGATDQKVFPNSSTTDSLADLAFHYWATDLFGTAANDNVNPYFAEDPADENALTDAEYWNPANDPATWQHMVSYMVAFGLSGTVPVPDASVYAALLAGTSYTNNNGVSATGWPNNNFNAGKADDVYHAGLNGRGGFFNAADPNELVSAFSDILFNLQDRQASASTVVADSGRISSDNLLYIARYNTGKWVGQLQAYNVSDGSDFNPASPGTGCNAKPFGERCGEVWDAGALNTEATLNANTREIITYSSTATSGDPAGSGVDFSWSSLNATQQALLNNGDGLGQQRVNYLRGDDSNEVDQGGSFRIRSGLTKGASASRFGPVFHASPVYVGNGVDASGLQQFDFDDTLESAPYSSFLSSISGRTPIIYVGGNDGMLHAINASQSGGNELFSYVPNAIMGKLPDLTKPSFQSGAFVDGPIAVQDVFYNSSWHTLLVGGLRTGGQGYYSLDVTNPLSSGGSVDPLDVVNWEYTDVNDPDMGYTFGEPQIVRSNYNGGKWVVIVGNGYNSTVADGNVGSGKAVLFVLDAADGSQIAKIEVGNGNTSTPSGLSTPVAVFADGDANADYAYAGDLDGNMWKFDLTSADATQWSAVKLYSAGSSRPITGKPTVGNHPANLPGRIVYFGTGKYIESSDTASTPAQAFYGILDDDTCGSSGTACVSSGSLITQSLTSAGSGNSTTSDNAINWATNKGWVLPLVNGGSAAERVVGSPAVLGNVVIFLSIVPKSDPCESGGSNILYVLGRSNGGRTDRQVIDINQDGVVNGDDTNNDEVVNVYTIDNDVPVTDGRIIISTKGDKGAFFTDENSEGLNNFGQFGRIRWRQLK